MSGRQYSFHGVSGLTLYAHLFDGSGKIWNGSAFETYNVSNWSTYTVAMTEIGTSGLYQFDWPSMPAGTYSWLPYVQAGGSAASTDLAAGPGNAVQWDGDSLVVLPTTTPVDGTVALVGFLSGLQVYGVIFDESGQAWNGSSFGSYSDGSWSTYAVSAGEQGATGVYAFTFPAGIVTAGWYTVVFCSTGLAITPALGDSKINLEIIPWSGAAIYEPAFGVPLNMVGSPVSATWLPGQGAIAAGSSNILDGTALSAVWSVPAGTIGNGAALTLLGSVVSSAWSLPPGVISAAAGSVLVGSPVIGTWVVPSGSLAAAPDTISHLYGSPVQSQWTTPQGFIAAPTPMAPAGDTETALELDETASLAEIKANCYRIMAEITASPKPSYSIDGQAVSWTEYMRMLREQIDWINANELAADPFNLETFALLE